MSENLMRKEDAPSGTATPDTHRSRSSSITLAQSVALTIVAEMARCNNVDASVASSVSSLVNSQNPSGTGSMDHLYYNPRMPSAIHEVPDSAEQETPSLSRVPSRAHP